MDTAVALVRAFSANTSVMFVMAFLMGAWWEWRCPVRPRAHAIGARWVCNASLHFINTLIGAWLAPLAGAGVAFIATKYTAGILPMLSWEGPSLWLTSILVLDCTHYLFHRLSHRVGWMWQFHCVHHSDLDCDITTGIRSHPFETIAILPLYCAVVGFFGIPIAMLLWYEVLTTFSQFFTHGNMHINATTERVLRLVLVTPPMHRIHHSADLAEENSNFGGLLTFWDRLFGTYKAKSQLGPDQIVFGLSEYRTRNSLNLRRLLSMPFAKSTPQTLP